MTDKKDEKDELPKIEVPEKYQPYDNVSVSRKNEKYFIDSTVNDDKIFMVSKENNKKNSVDSDKNNE